VFVLPVTDALNCFAAPFCSEADVGLIETPMAAGAVTVTVAPANFVVSATLVALTVYVPAVEGAKYVIELPEPEIAPPDTDHVTEAFEELLTVAANATLAPGEMETLLGLIKTEIFDDEVTDTVAEADLVLSATLVAFTV